MIVMLLLFLLLSLVVVVVLIIVELQLLASLSCVQQYRMYRMLNVECWMFNVQAWFNVCALSLLRPCFLLPRQTQKHKNTKKNVTKRQGAVLYLFLSPIFVPNGRLNYNRYSEFCVLLFYNRHSTDPVLLPTVNWENSAQQTPHHSHTSFDKQQQQQQHCNNIIQSDDTIALVLLL